MTSLITPAKGPPRPRITPVRAAVIKLASLTMATGDPDEATSIATVAVGRAADLKSLRAAEDIHELNSYARRAGVDLMQAAAG